jgi:hypothetical protein
LDRLLRDYIQAEQGREGTRALVRDLTAKVDDLGRGVTQHLVDDERRHGEVMARVETHELRLHSAEQWGGWVKGVMAVLVAAGAIAAAARLF